MLIQAAGLALLASLSPTALLVAAVYLGSARPRLTAVIYLTGAVVMSLVMGIVVIINVLLVWLPILLYIAAPNVTTRFLQAFNNWLRTHARAILCVVMAAAGVIMVANGIYGLAVRQ